ncbi:hypothetical protein QJS10_CPA07g00180 [Acorus calamus]|uniref:DCD domain-containing protein n=1 Tax=Acorus calamus TaxID=4465 RepID=A0AAV9EFU4_ACOCL|nr:hypothetical protein QJS10_CPA07g00180 [Acorus calamus]
MGEESPKAEDGNSEMPTTAEVAGDESHEIEVGAEEEMMGDTSGDGEDVMVEEKEPPVGSGDAGANVEGEAPREKAEGKVEGDVKVETKVVKTFLGKTKKLAKRKKIVRKKPSTSTKVARLEVADVTKEVSPATVESNEKVEGGEVKEMEVDAKSKAKKLNKRKINKVEEEIEIENDDVKEEAITETSNKKDNDVKEEARNATSNKKRKLRKQGKKNKAEEVGVAVGGNDASVSNGLNETESLASEKKDKERKKKGKLSGKVVPMGLIFMCNAKTKQDCFRYKVFGLPANKKEMVSEVYKGMSLFLFDVDLKLLYGIYKAAGPGGYNLEPKAFNSHFPSQVHFQILDDCLPLPEERFKSAIKSNYNGKNKFNCKLSEEQVKDLCKLFRKTTKCTNQNPSGRVIKAPKSSPAEGSRKKGSKPVRPNERSGERQRERFRHTERSRERQQRERSRPDERSRERQQRERARSDERSRKRRREQPRSPRRTLPPVEDRTYSRRLDPYMAPYAPPPSLPPPIPHYTYDRPLDIDPYRRDSQVDPYNALYRNHEARLPEPGRFESQDPYRTSYGAPPPPLPLPLPSLSYHHHDPPYSSTYPQPLEYTYPPPSSTAPPVYRRCTDIDC